MRVYASASVSERERVSSMIRVEWCEPLGASTLSR